MIANDWCAYDAFTHLILLYRIDIHEFNVVSNYNNRFIYVDKLQTTFLYQYSAVQLIEKCEQKKTKINEK